MGRRLGFWLALGILVLAAVEGLAHAAVWLRDGVPLSPAANDSLRRGLIEEADPARAPAGAEPERPEARFRDQVVHPYFGFAADPAQGAGEAGFYNPGFPTDPDVATVVVLGGSLAHELVLRMRLRMERALERLPEFAGRRVRVLDYALPGFKQPQQLMVLNVLLVEGLRPDVVVNVDGFNEVALPLLDNRPRGIHPLYPRGWDLRVAGFEDAESRRLVGRIVLLRDRRAARAGWCAAPPLRWSAVCDLLWQRLDRADAAALASAQQALAERAAHQRDFRSHGPAAPELPAPAYVAEAAALWMRASRLMDELCRANGARYLHFLQPNQYVEGSKPMGSGERHRAFDPDSRWRRAVTVGYPELAGRGEELTAAGVDFHDLRLLFAGRQEPAYRDRCCHLNKGGNLILADRIVAAVGGG